MDAVAGTAVCWLRRDSVDGAVGPLNYNLRHVVTISVGLSSFSFLSLLGVEEEDILIRKTTPNRSFLTTE